MDPIITALMSGVALVGAGLTKKATDDLYNRLKTLIKNKYSKYREIDKALENWEEKPQSEGRQKTLKEELDVANVSCDEELLVVAKELLSHVEAVPDLPEGIANLIRIYNSKVQVNINVNLIARRATESLLEQSILDQHNNAALFNITEKYMAYLLDRYRFMDFRGMGTLNVPLNVMLHEMYVPLEARIGLPEGGTWTHHFQLRGKPINSEEVDVFGPHLNKPLLLIDLLKETKNRVLVILGDPGTGKTTFLKHITVQLAQGIELGIGSHLPVLIPLSAYANALTEGDVSLKSFISDYYTKILGDSLDFKPIIDSFLEQGRALILLDGLDEVHSLDQRILTMNHVNDFLSSPKCKSAGNRFVITSRIIGYNAVRPMTGGLLECVLTDFSENQMKQFIDNWNAIVARMRYDNEGTATAEAKYDSKELLAIINSSSNLNRLATNPLLFTILLLMQRQKVNIPYQRVELYHVYIRTLIIDWHNARSLHRPSKYPLSVQKTLRILAPLAFWIQESSAGTGIVREYDVRCKLQEIFAEQGEANYSEAAEEFLRDVSQYTALFLERGIDAYGFIHLSFQEFLSAMYVVENGQRSIEPITNAILQRVNNDIWHEVIRLTIAYIGVIQNRNEVASDVLCALLDFPTGLATILAGDAALDTLPDGITKECKDQVIKHLENTLVGTTQSEPPMIRFDAGNLLAKLGDPRKEVLDIDKMLFCFIPKGEFWTGEGNNAQIANSIEYNYWIGCYPVTVSQFQAFAVTAKFKVTDIQSLSEPDNRPIVWVTLDDAKKFCTWLTSKCWNENILGKDWVIRLPKETEWEKAARGGVEILKLPVIASIENLDQPEMNLIQNPHPTRKYPWGKDPTGDLLDKDKANYDETGLGIACSVGCFPKGISPYGVQDMSGNTWDWTQSLYINPYETIPEIIDERRRSDMVLKGGSFYFKGNLTRCSFRGRKDPEIWGGDIGFRVVVAPVNA